MSSTRRVGVASGAVVALAASSLTFFAVTSKGETVHRADLNDGGVWVSSSKDARFARVNKAVGQFDAGVVASSGPGDPVDVVQDDNAVAGLVSSSGALTAIEPTTGRLDESTGVTVPPQSVATNLKVFVPQTVDLRGGTVAIVDPRTGKVWGQTYDPAVGLTLARGPHRRRQAARRASAPWRPWPSTCAAASTPSPARPARVVSIPRTAAGFGTPSHRRRSACSDAKVVDITAVGTRWVVYSAGDDKLWVQGSDKAVDGGTAREEGQPAYAVLQQPGPDADSVGLQDAVEPAAVGPRRRGRLRRCPGPPRRGRGAAAAVPPAAHRLVHPRGLGQRGRQLLRQGLRLRPSRSRPCHRAHDDRGGRAVGVSLRTNHGLVVLNDLDGGEVWDLDSKPKKLDEWDSLIPPPQDGQGHQEEGREPHRRGVGSRSRRRPSRTSSRSAPAAPPSCTSSTTTPTQRARCWPSTPATSARPDLTGVTASVSADGQTIDVTVPAAPDKPVVLVRPTRSTTARRRRSRKAKVTVTPRPGRGQHPAGAAARHRQPRPAGLPRQSGQAPAGAGRR